MSDDIFLGTEPKVSGTPTVPSGHGLTDVASGGQENEESNL